MTAVDLDCIDENQAFEALIHAFAEDYGDDETVERLERAAQATGRWAELLSTTNGWLQEDHQLIRRVQLLLRLGKWYAEDLAHPEHAQPYYRKVMELDPRNVQVHHRLAAIHRQQKKWHAVGEDLTRALNFTVDTKDRAAVLHELGELLEKNMRQVDQATVFYRRAVEVDPTHTPAREALERLAKNKGRPSAPEPERQVMPEGFFRDAVGDAGTRSNGSIGLVLILCLVLLGVLYWLSK